LLLDKPEGPSSHDAVAAVRRALRVRRAGHCGTLDPFASGLLLLLLGPATRLARFLVELAKRYTGVIVLGTVTETDDRTGAVVRTSEAWRALSEADLAGAAAALTGRQLQRPPAFSAKHMGGRRAYRLARRGAPLLLPAQEVEVYRFTVTRRDGPRVLFEVEVGSGAYVRGLARDFGERLGCGAHLGTLRRTAVGPFTVEEAVPLEEVREDTPLRSPLAAVAHLPTVPVNPVEREAVVHGRSLRTPEDGTGPVALVADGELIAVAERHGDVLRPRVVLAE
jgi:tRNA pseudouridine55 synthase